MYFSSSPFPKVGIIIFSLASSMFWLAEIRPLTDSMKINLSSLVWNSSQRGNYLTLYLNLCLSTFSESMSLKFWEYLAQYCNSITVHTKELCLDLSISRQLTWFALVCSHLWNMQRAFVHAQSPAMQINRGCALTLSCGVSLFLAVMDLPSYIIFILMTIEV